MGRAEPEADATESTRSRLIAAAIELVRDGGEDALSMRALGDRCGLSRGASYRHFDDKDALIRAIAAAGFAELHTRMQRSARAARGSRLGSAMHAYIAWALANPDWYRLTFQRPAAATMGDKDDADLKLAAGGLLDFVLALVVEAQDLGDLPAVPAPALFGVLWATLHGAVDLALAGHAKEELQMGPRRVVDNLLDALAAGKKPAPRRRAGRI